MPIEFNSLSDDNRVLRKKAHAQCLQFNRDPSKGHLKQLKRLFANFGEHLIIETGFHCDYGNKISFGDRVYININCTLLDGGRIVIGDDVLVGPNVQMITVNHPLCPKERLNKTNLAKDISVGNNVWIGAGAIILPGVKIGDDTVVGAGSVVTKNIEGNSLYAGNPAVKLKDVL